MSEKTKNKLMFSRKKAVAVKGKKRFSQSSPSSVKPEPPPPEPTPSAPPIPPPVQPRVEPEPSALQPSSVEIETHEAQLVEHASRIPAEQPIDTIPPTPSEQAMPSPEADSVTVDSSKNGIESPRSSESPSAQSQLELAPAQPPNFKETENLREQVANYLEICDSCLNGEFEPTDIIDLIHVLIMSLSLDVVSLALVDPERHGKLRQVVSRGYGIPPTKHVVECWEKALTVNGELHWDKLMKIATDKNTELACWVISENLDSVGYVPIRDGKRLYGFLFVASKTKKKPSIIKSELLDACGSRLGITYSELYR